jgi:hypothetical protein
MVEPSPSMLPFFADTKLIVHPDDYVVVSVPPAQSAEAHRLRLRPFNSVTYDYSEVSLVIRASEWAINESRFREARVEGPYTLITFDIALDLSLVGYLSVVSSLLAQNGVSIYALSTYLRDHILVKKEDSEKAVEALTRLIERSNLLLKE